MSEIDGRDTYQLSQFYEFIKLLNKDEKIKLAFLILLVMTNAVIEIISLSALAWFTQIAVVRDNSFDALGFYGLDLSGLNIHNSESVDIWSASAIILIIFSLRFSVAVCVSLFQQRIVFSFFERLNIELFEVYLAASTSFHDNHHTAGMIRNLKRSIPLMAVGILNPAVNFVVNTLLFVSVAVYLIFQNIYLFGALIVFMGFVILNISNLASRLVAIYGKRAQQQEKISLKIFQDAIALSKEARIWAKNYFFESRFGSSISIQAESAKKSSLLTQLIPVSIELVAICGLTLGIVFMVNGADSDQITGQVAMFILGLMRLRSYGSGIIQAATKIGFNLPVVNEISNDLRLPTFKKGDAVNKLHFVDELRIESANLFDPTVKANRLTDINISINRGDRVAVIGPSGSGKTTFLEALAGLIPFTSGKVILDGDDKVYSSKRWFTFLGYVQQKTAVLDDTLLANIVFGDRQDDARLERVLKIACLTDDSSKSISDINKPVGQMGAKMSGGQTQRIGLARALYKDCEVLIMDEPTASLDPTTELKIMSSLIEFAEEKKLTIVMATHRAELISSMYFDRVLELRDGCLIELDVSVLEGHQC